MNLEFLFVLSQKKKKGIIIDKIMLLVTVLFDLNNE